MQENMVFLPVYNGDWNHDDYQKLMVYIILILGVTPKYHPISEKKNKASWYAMHINLLQKPVTFKIANQRSKTHYKITHF